MQGTVQMAFYIELEFHDEARGHEDKILWRSQLPDMFTSTSTADLAGKKTLSQMSKAIDVVSYRIVDDIGNVLDKGGKVLGRRNVG